MTQLSFILASQQRQKLRWVISKTRCARWQYVLRRNKGEGGKRLCGNATSSKSQLFLLLLLLLFLSLVFQQIARKLTKKKKERKSSQELLTIILTTGEEKGTTKEKNELKKKETLRTVPRSRPKSQKRRAAALSGHFHRDL